MKCWPEPPPPLMLDGEAIDRALARWADFADLVSPYLSGHSAGVAELAGAAAERCGIEAAGVGDDAAGGSRPRPRSRRRRTRGSGRSPGR